MAAMLVGYNNIRGDWKEHIVLCEFGFKAQRKFRRRLSPYLYVVFFHSVIKFTMVPIVSKPRFLG